ncbi:hypothetical protein A7X97_20850 [Stenotrophomonas sepilia]|nr:hypothetical protein A7X97_20850 [Stenotrophomonas sepilia]
MDVAQRSESILACPLDFQGNADIRKKLPSRTSQRVHVDTSFPLDACVVQGFPGEVHAVVANILIVLAEDEFLRVRW